jgi:beta-mannosidase
LRLELHGYNAQDAETIAVNHLLTLPARSQQTLLADTLIGHFTDLPHAYRFGPIQHRLIHARLFDSNTNALLSEDFYFPKREFLPRKRQQAVEITTRETATGEYVITVQSSTFLQWVKIDLPDCFLSNNYFHLAPNTPTDIIAHRHNVAETTPLKGYVEAINLQEAIRIRF